MQINSPHSIMDHATPVMKQFTPQTATEADYCAGEGRRYSEEMSFQVSIYRVLRSVGLMGIMVAAVAFVLA